MNDLITDVGIDLDGVIYPFIDAFKIYCKERLNVSYLPDATKWNFYEDWGIDHDTFQEWISDAATTHKVFSTYAPDKEVIEAWQQMKDMGLGIHVMTARPQSAWAQTADWLLTHKLVADSLHFHPSKKFLFNISKGKAAMIDDHVQYYKEAKSSSIIPCLLDRPWNQTEDNLNRVKTLTEFIGFIKGYNSSVVIKPSAIATIKQETPPWIYPNKKKHEDYTFRNQQTPQEPNFFVRQYD